MRDLILEEIKTRANSPLFCLEGKMDLYRIITLCEKQEHFDFVVEVMVEVLKINLNKHSKEGAFFIKRYDLFKALDFLSLTMAYLQSHDTFSTSDLEKLHEKMLNKFYFID